MSSSLEIDGTQLPVITVEVTTSNRNLGTIAEVAPATAATTTVDDDNDGDVSPATAPTTAPTTARSSSHSVRLPKDKTLSFESYSRFKTNLYGSERHRIVESRRQAAEAVKEHKRKMDEAAREMDHYERRVIQSFSERWSKQFPIGERRPRGYTYSRAQSAGSVSLMGNYRIGSGAGSALPHFSRNAVGSRLSRSLSAGAVSLSSCTKCSTRASHLHEGDGGRRWGGIGLPKTCHNCGRWRTIDTFQHGWQHHPHEGRRDRNRREP
eukprot:m.1359 g.1359  ORF g.1359 m.1359 type:complete len:266 (+) comp6302_c0_seq1:39-836(+)